jgi:hypothetical protein
MRRWLGWSLVVAGLACYNWWLPVALAGRVPSVNALFSDLEASGQPSAAVYQRLDAASGVLLLLAFLLRGPEAAGRAERRLLLAFAAAGTVGGLFPYRCPEGLDPRCRAAEWRLQLGLSQYAHVAAGIVEFGCATAIAVLAARRTRGGRDRVSRAYRGNALLLVAGYPLLAVAYLLHLLGALVEPLFFLCFSALVVLERLERPPQPAPRELPEPGRARPGAAEPATPARPRPDRRSPRGHDRLSG